MDQQHTLIKGYRDLTEVEIDTMNLIKHHAEQVGKLISDLEGPSVGGALQPDGRWLAIAKTDLQKGFMFLTRAIAKPTTF